MAIDGKTVRINHLGKDYSFIIRTEPITAQDEMWIESKKKQYLFDKISPDEREITKSIYLATFELIVLAGLDMSQGMRVFQAVGRLPGPVINAVMKEFNAQFIREGDLEVEKKS